MLTIAQFVSQTKGREFGNPPPLLVPNQGTYQGECVSIVRHLLEAVYGIQTAAWGNAVDYWMNTPAVLLQHFDKIPAGQSLQEGDITVWGDDPGNWTNQFGHIALYTNGLIYGQNYNGRRTADFNSFFPQGYLGALRFKGNTMSTTDLGSERILAFGIAGRNGFDGRPNSLNGDTDADLNGHVGKESQSEIWGWYNSKEGQNYIHNVLPGVYAARDQANAKVSSQTTTIAQLQGQVKDLTAQLAIQSQDTQNLNSIGTLLKWFIIRVGLGK